MNLRHTLDQLVVLDAIDRTGSFAGAARQLHRVPSAVSYAIRALEEGLGVEVFDRSGHRAVLTPSGRRVLEGGRRVLEQARALDGLATSLGEGWEPELQVVVDGATSMGPVTAALRALGEAGAPTRVRVDVEFQDGVHDRFHDDHADMMLVLEPEAEGPFLATPLGLLPMVLVAGCAHPLAGRSGVDRAELLAHTELVVRDSSHKYRTQPRKAFLGSRHVMYLSDFHSKRLGIEAGAGFGWLPLHVAQEGLQRGLLVPVDLPGANTWDYHPHLVTRREEPLGRAGRLFFDSFVRATRGS